MNDHTRETHLSEMDFARLKRAMGDEIKQHVPGMLSDIFEKLGIDITTPESRSRFRGDLAFLSGLKVGAETMKRGFHKRAGDAFVGAILAVIAAASSYAFWHKPPI